MSVTLAILEAVYSVGATLYKVLFNRTTGQAWNNNTLVWETYNSAHWPQYAIALTEKAGSGYYTASSPAGIAGALVTDVLYLQAGGSPAISDAPPQALNHSIGDNVAAISGDAAAAPTNLQSALKTETQGEAAGTPSTSVIPTDLTNATSGAYAGLTVRFITGAAAGMAGLIADYTVTDGVLTLSGGLAVAPAAGDLFIIV